MVGATDCRREVIQPPCAIGRACVPTCTTGEGEQSGAKYLSESAAAASTSISPCSTTVVAASGTGALTRWRMPVAPVYEALRLGLSVSCDIVIYGKILVCCTPRGIQNFDCNNEFSSLAYL